MPAGNQREVLAALLGTLRSFTVAIRNIGERGRLRLGGISWRAEVLYDSLLWGEGEEPVDFVDVLPKKTRHAVEDLLDALLDDGPDFDALLALRLPRGSVALSRICDLICVVAEVASQEFGSAGLDISDCAALGATVQTAAQLVRAA
jgi:hypothetical protein